jgi:drug/metabolite transporter (DMT)-like permease
MNTIVLLIIYVVSGALQPVLIEILNYNGACEESTLIFLLPTYLGMSLSFLSDLKLKFSDIKDYKSIGLLCLLDIISQTLNYSGLIFAGSLVFTILYSSCTMWAALFSRLILYKKLHNLQWMGVFIILIGLLIGSLDSANEGKNVFIGVILILSGSMLHSLTYIVSEIMLSHTIDPSPPEIISSIMGITGIIVFGAWQIIHTLPNYRTLVIDNIASHHGSLTSITFAFLGLAIDSLIHIPCLFYMIGRVGATTTGNLASLMISILCLNLST